jgi:hypothetical protein
MHLDRTTPHLTSTPGAASAHSHGTPGPAVEAAVGTTDMPLDMSTLMSTSPCAQGVGMGAG